MSEMPRCKQCGWQRKDSDETWETLDYCSEECMDAAYAEGKIQ